jgi:hypothetical protein
MWRERQEARKSKKALVKDKRERLALAKDLCNRVFSAIDGYGCSK